MISLLHDNPYVLPVHRAVIVQVASDPREELPTQQGPGFADTDQAVGPRGSKDQKGDHPVRAVSGQEAGRRNAHGDLVAADLEKPCDADRRNAAALGSGERKRDLVAARYLDRDRKSQLKRSDESVLEDLAYLNRRRRYR